jgi:DNA-binding transcriptional MerR regulator
MRIGELSQRTDVPTRMLRYYEEQGLLHPTRDASGYRSYAATDTYRALQIRGLLAAGLTTEIIRDILPCLEDPEQVRITPRRISADTAEALDRHLDRVQQRIDCLTRNRDAIRSYIDAVRAPRRKRTAQAFNETRTSAQSSRTTRIVDAGSFSSLTAGRNGRGTKLPPQFGQTPPNRLSTQSAQNVHS